MRKNAAKQLRDFWVFVVLQMLADCYSYRKFLSRPCVPGHVGSTLNACIYYLAAGLQEISSSVYKGGQTPLASLGAAYSVRENLAAVGCVAGEVPAVSLGRGDAGCVRGCPAALTTSSIPAELMQGLWLCSELPADISLPPLWALGSRLSALPLNPKSWKHMHTFLCRKLSLLM